jgi:hypothetical protein
MEELICAETFEAFVNGSVCWKYVWYTVAENTLRHRKIMAYNVFKF